MISGIVGLGYVGSAMYSASMQSSYPDIHNTYQTFDIDPSKHSTCHSLSELVNLCDIIYIAVPTPTNMGTGKCDTSIVSTVIQEIAETASKSKIIVIKSTVPPGTTEELQKQHLQHTIIFSPEFLREKHANSDFIFQRTAIFGKPSTANELAVYAVIGEYYKLLYNGYYVMLDATTAELYKYVTNTFLATKVSFANEMNAVAKSLGVDWSVVAQYLEADPRMGNTHWQVPGPDLQYGFGGVCLPKDTAALISLANANNILTPVLDAVWLRNSNIDRPEQDWKLLVGRSVTE